MRSAHWWLVSASVFALACEDGPSQIFTPLPEDADPGTLNGQEVDRPWVEPGSRGFSDLQQGDEVGRASFCSELERTAQIKEMVVQPIVPDVSVGGVPLWRNDGSRISVDDLVGEPETGRLCEPTAVGSDIFIWGPANEVLVLFNEETRLVDAVVAYGDYLGTLSGSYTNSAGEKIPVVVKNREHILLNGVELDQYASRADQASRPTSWLNNANVTALYKMIRENFFGVQPLPDNFDCVAAKVCDITYTQPSDAAPQETWIVLVDSGVQIRMDPTGTVAYVLLLPVHVAPFETSGLIAFGRSGGSEMRFTYQSDPRANCTVDLGVSGMTWGDFKEKCIAAGDERALQRAGYDVHMMRDAVDVAFNGMTLTFLRAQGAPPLRDGEAPGDGDELYGVGYYRYLEANTQEFNHKRLALQYVENLKARLRASIVASGAHTLPEAHPFYDYSVAIPQGLEDGPGRIGELFYAGRGPSGAPEQLEFVSTVVDRIWSDYDALSPELKSMLDPRVRQEVYLIEPYVEAVLDAFSHGESQGSKAFRAFMETDDRRWSIGYAHFVRQGVPYRLTVQYKLDQRAITAVSVERGQSRVDALVDGWRELIQSAVGGDSAYYSIDYAYVDGNPLGLGGTGISVKGADRLLNSLEVEIAGPNPTSEEPQSFSVSGYPLEDRYGYSRQISGEAWDFVPANVVNLYGKETRMTYYVTGAGEIEAIWQHLFKGEVALCPGLRLGVGDDVRRSLEAYRAVAGDAALVDCQVVFNYAENGNVLDRVASLKYRRAFDVMNGRAYAVQVWR